MTFAHSLIIAALLPAADRLISLSRPDMAIIAVYFAVVLGIGMYLKNYAKSGEDFFMAGREMTAWVAGLSFISANLGAIELIGWAASAYEYGILAAHAYWIAAFPAIVILALVMMPFYYISKTHSVPGYLQLRYGEGARALSGISFAVMTVLMSGINMYAMALVMKVVVGWNIHFSIWVSSLTVAIYVVLGGLFSAIFNEVLQFFLIWLGALLIPILGLVEVGGWSGMVARIHQNFPGGDYTHLWRTLGTFTGNPMGIHWTGIVFGMGGAIACGYWTTDFLVVQRAMAAKDLTLGENGAPHRRLFQNGSALHRHSAGTAGAGGSALQARAGKCRGSGNAQLQRAVAADAGALLRTGPAGLGDYGAHRRVHVGNGGKRHRLRHGVDV
jgi:SSS family solute:Na+ symporter